MGSPVDIRDGKANCQVETDGYENTLYISAVLTVDHQDRTEEAKTAPDTPIEYPLKGKK